MKTEHQTYNRMLQDELVGQNGRYVIFYKDRLLGVFDGYNEALKTGYEACGFAPFLLRKVPIDLPLHNLAERPELQAA